LDQLNFEHLPNVLTSLPILHFPEYRGAARLRFLKNIVNWQQIYALNMHGINEITYEHIEQLDERQLVKLLDKLLALEARKYQLPAATIVVPQNTKSKDGGSDGRLQWVGGPITTPRFKNRYTVFQSKAADLIPSKCADEIFPKAKKGQTQKLKPQVEDVVDQGGSYILINSRALTDQGITARIDAFRTALKAAKKSNYSSFNIEVFDANYLAKWTNEHASAVNLVKEFHGSSLPEGFRNWESLEIDIAASNTPFQINDKTVANIQAIQQNINIDKVIRISGNSGLGKTRFILETFRATDSQTMALNHDFLYYDLGASGEESKLINFIISQRESQQGIIVVDNCDSEFHLKIADLVRNQGGLKVITIGYDDNTAITDNKIRLLRNEQRDLVRKIIVQKLTDSHSEQEMDYVERLSEGYPWMAVRFCDLILKTGIRDFDKQLDELSIKKLIFGAKNPDETEYEILKACSVFSAFGFVDDSFSRVVNGQFKASLQKQMDFIREQVCDVTVTAAKFSQTCEKFRKEDIIERRGTHYIVKPTVLAIQLAAQWLRHTPIDKVKNIIEELSLVGLQEKFMQRLTDLDQLDKAKEIVEEFWGPGSPFGSAEVLSTAWGSLLFRYVVEVNPKATCAAIEGAFEGWSSTQLSEISKSRRNIVVSLEKLAFRKETFFSATKMLFRLAISENESWANNATAQVSQLFRRFLAGTEVDYDARLEVLEWALDQHGEAYIGLALSCMRGAFIPQGQHSRMGGAESQGSGASLVDYMPPTWKHVYDYWQPIIDRLIPIVNDGGELGEKALSVLARAARTTCAEGATEMFLSALEKVSFRPAAAWMVMRTELKKILRYEHTLLNDEQIGKIQEIIDEYQPKDLREEFLSIVSKPDWEHEPPIVRDGRNVYKQQLVTEAFAKRLIDENKDWKDQIPELVQGEQRQGFTFGFEMGKNHPGAKDFADQAIQALKTTEKSRQNPGFLFGLAGGIAEVSFFESLFDRLLADTSLNHLAIQLTRQHEFALDRLMELFKLVDEQQHSVTELDYFKYGKPLQYLSDREFYALLDRIATYQPDGPPTAFSILFMQCFQNDDNFKRYQKKLKELISGSNLLLSRAAGFESFYWGETAAKLLSETKDVEFAKVIAAQLAEFSEHQNFSYAFDQDAATIFELLLRKYFKQSWPYIADKLSENYLSLQNLKSMIGAKNGSHSKEGFLFSHPQNYKKIYDWAANSERGSIMLANILPFYSLVEVEDAETGVKTKEAFVHPFTIGFLELFGAEEGILDEISANIGTFSTVGGSGKYFLMLKNLFQTLISHRIPKVRDWAKRAVDYYAKSIILEKLEHDNRLLE
jgi:hypothetical protein